MCSVEPSPQLVCIRKGFHGEVSPAESVCHSSRFQGPEESCSEQPVSKVYLTSAQSPLPLHLRPTIGPRETPAGASRGDLCQVGVFSSKVAACPRAGCAAAVPITLRRHVEMVLSGHLPFRIRSWGWVMAPHLPSLLLVGLPSSGFASSGHWPRCHLPSGGFLATRTGTRACLLSSHHCPATSELLLSAAL